MDKVREKYHMLSGSGGKKVSLHKDDHRLQGKRQPKEGIRLNKYLSEAGICSRRQADRYVEEGRILVDGKPALPGQKVTDDQEILVDHQPVAGRQDRKVTIALYKPKGIVCTTEEREKDNIIDYLNYPVRIYPVGRLDKDSEGLILLTNDGDLMNEILKARNYHEKEYQVEVNRPVTAEFLRQMSQGVEILDTKTRPCKVRKTGFKSFSIVLTQGLNRQIRRMCEALDYRVRALKRTRVMNITLKGLEPGRYREIRGEELYELYHQTGLKPPGRLPVDGPKKDQPIMKA